MLIPTMDTEEYFFDCPSCGEAISVILDLSAGRQDYIEDCEVCCRPLQIGFDVTEGSVAGFSVSMS